MEATIYVGKYKVPKNGVIPLPKTTKLRVLSYYLGIDEKGNSWKDDRLTITLEDENFWPVVIKLSDHEATRLVEVLQEILEHRKSNSTEQKTYAI